MQGGAGIWHACRGLGAAAADPQGVWVRGGAGAACEGPGLQGGSLAIPHCWAAAMQFSCGCIEARVCHGSIGAHLQTAPLHAICLHGPLHALSLPVKLSACSLRWKRLDLQRMRYGTWSCVGCNRGGSQRGTDREKESLSNECGNAVCFQLRVA